MTTITIPKTLFEKQNLIAVPRDTYEEFLRWTKEVKSLKTFKPSIAEKKALQRARKNFVEGKCFTIKELKRELGIAH